MDPPGEREGRGMTPGPVSTRRNGCRRHALCAAGQRGVPMGLCEFIRLERKLDTLRPAFEVPGRDLYLVHVKRRRDRVNVIYDTKRRCLVTIWPRAAGRLA